MIWVAAAVAVCAAAAGRDLQARCIDNILVVLLGLSWIGLAAVSGGNWQMILGHLAVGAAALVIGAVSYWPGWIGGGDVKLAAAVFLWAGPDLGLVVFEITGLAGLALAVAGEAARWLERLPLPAPALKGLALISTERGVPYGVALSLGGMVAALGSLGQNTG